MNISWSPEAIAELHRRYGHNANEWKLVYDTEGCGCAVNGVPALWAVSEPEKGDLAAGSTGNILWYNKLQAVFFEDDMRISYQEDKRSFTLASDNQIYTTRLLITDRRKSD
jgi:uncharacterized protein YqkB